MDLFFDDATVDLSVELDNVHPKEPAAAVSAPDLTNAIWLADDGFESDLGARDLTHRFGILAEVLRASHDDDGDAQNVVWVGNAVGGSVSLGGEGQGDNVFFDAFVGFNGTASFDYIVSDGKGEFARKSAVFDALDTVLWSDLFEDAGAEDEIVIGADQRVILDQSADVGSIVVNGGELIIADHIDLSLSTDWLLVLNGGLFRAGREVEGHVHNFELELTGDDPDRTIDISDWARGGMADTITGNDGFLMSMGMGSAIDIHAADRSLASWAQLDATANAGDDWLTIDTATGWQVGDVIAVASSEFSADQAEQRRIVEVRDGGSEVRLDRPLDYRHYGELETYGNVDRQWTLDMRAEVALLSRNITISGALAASDTRIGGHIMAMMGGDMRISGTEITRMGQEGVLGRYGAHWHLSGDASGDYLRNNSFHEIYNKGIVMHGVQNVDISENVVFGTIGHSVFTEDAAEFGNTIRDNLVFGTQAASSLESALTTADFDHVSSYWIENPNNIITGNHAAGSDFAGFWFAPSEVHGAAKDTGLYDGLSPKNDPILDFTGNTSHSNAFNLGIEGHVTGEASDKPAFHQTLYAPDAPWDVTDFTAYKSTDRSIWSRAHGGTFSDIKSADNTRATFFSHTQTMTDSLIVGRSDGNGFTTGGPFGHRGHSIYDGPSGLEDVHFANFNGGDHAIQTNGAAEKATTHFVKGLTFENVAESNKVDFYGGLGSAPYDFMWATALRDLDGSLTGIPGATVSTKIREWDNEGTMLTAASDAIARDDWDAWISSDVEIGWMRIVPSFDGGAITDPAVVSTRYDIVRSDGETLVNASPTFDVLINPSVVIEDGLSYDIRFHEVPSELSVTFRGLSDGSEVFYTYKGLPSLTEVLGASEVSSTAELEAATETSFLREETDFVFKVIADEQTYLLPNSEDPEALERNFGSRFILKTGLPNDSANVVADFDLGLDLRGQTAASDMAVSLLQAGGEDQHDTFNFWTATADGGTMGHADFHLALSGDEVWSAFDTIGVTTALSGSKVGYELILHDAGDGTVSLGRFNEGAAQGDLSSVDARYLDEVSGLTLRTHEADLGVGGHQRIELSKVTLS